MPTPGPFASPVPVIIVGGGYNWWLTVFVPLASLAVAAVAALCAALALMRIATQITLANEQTRLAREGIDWAKKDFAATMQGLTITTGQARKADEERAREPDLVVTADGEKDSTLAIDTTVSSSLTYHFFLSFSVENIGQRTATDVSVDFSFSGIEHDPGPLQTQREVYIQPGGFATARLPDSITPGTRQRVGRIGGMVRAPGTFSVAWIARSSESVTASKTWQGTIRIDVTPRT